MAKYSLESKLAAARSYLDGVESFKDIAQKYSVDKTLLKDWVARYREHGLAAFQETYTDYSIEFKMDVINYIHETGASIREASSKFNISTHSTVKRWKDLFEKQGIDALQSKKRGRPPVKNDKENSLPIEGSDEALKAENERLRMENAYLKKLHALIQEKTKFQNKIKRK